MSVAVKVGKGAIRMVSGILDTAVLTAVLLLVVIGSYAMWDSSQIYRDASPTRYEIYKPTLGNVGRFAELQEINPDVFAWLTVYGTNIDYPIVQGRDNMRYVNTSAEGRYSLSGAIFLDANNAADFSDFNSILYGHHMDKQTMFGEIGRFTDLSYFTARRYGMLYYDGAEHGLEFFAFVHADAYDGSVFKTSVTEVEAKQAYLDRLYELAIHIRSMPVTPDDHIILLSTCSSASTNGRDILVGKIVDDLYDDPFNTKGTGQAANAAVDGLPGLWESTPTWVRIIIFVLPLLVLLLVGALIIRRNKRRKDDIKVYRKGDR